jgi:hypothetical protein
MGILKNGQGKIYTRDKGKLIKVFAVIASPTSQEFFRYYERVGQKTEYHPSDRIPAECKNQSHVLAHLP